MMDHKALVEFEIEVGKMTAVNHPCIVRCYGMLDPSPGIVMELVQGGALFQILHGERGETYDQYKQRLPWSQRLRFLLDAMYGLRAVHNANLIHGDFKTLNLLVERDQRVKVRRVTLRCYCTLARPCFSLPSFPVCVVLVFHTGGVVNRWRTSGCLRCWMRCQCFQEPRL